jgi:hypothetical protein
MTDRPRSPDIPPEPPTRAADAPGIATRDVAPEPIEHDERTSTNMPDAPRKMVRLTLQAQARSTPFTGELKIGNSTYQVVDGVVDVPPWHADDARQAGYQG